MDRQGLTALDHLTGSLVLPAVVLLICSIVALLSGIVAVPLTPAALVRVTLMALGHVAVAVLLAALSFTRLPSTRLGEIPTPVTGAATALLLWLLADTPLPPGTDVVGSFWTRANDPEIDIIGGDRSPTATRITAVGSIKWHDKAPFDARDLARLTHHRDRLPGADPGTPLLAVSRTGCTIDGLPVLTPAELITAWPVRARGGTGSLDHPDARPRRADPCRRGPRPDDDTIGRRPHRREPKTPPGGPSKVEE